MKGKTEDILQKLVRAYTQDRSDGSVAVYGITENDCRFVLNCKELYGRKNNRNLFVV